MTEFLRAGVASAALVLGAGLGAPIIAHADDDGPTIKRVLLISIDGMHALDFANCSHGVNGGAAYCPNLAELAERGLTYTQTSTSRPSDSFPGLTALVTGGSPRSTGAFYDVSYDRSLSPPKVTTPYGIIGGAALCPASSAPRSASMKRSTST
jgi:Type I phosphodiesterase / nucleotide pyrophosphatase